MGNSSDVPAIIAAVASLVTALAVLLSVILTFRVHKEVKTSNGKSIAVLADLNEGRRIEAHVPPDDRTPEDDRYVELVEADRSTDVA